MITKILKKLLKTFSKLQKMKNTQSKIKAIKIGKQLHIVLGVKIIQKILDQKK